MVILTHVLMQRMHAGNESPILIISDERLQRRGFAYDSSGKPVPKQVLTKSLCRKRTVVLHAPPLVPGEHHIRIVSEKERRALSKDDTLSPEGEWDEIPDRIHVNHNRPTVDWTCLETTAYSKALEAGNGQTQRRETLMLLA